MRVIFWKLLWFSDNSIYQLFASVCWWVEKKCTPFIWFFNFLNFMLRENIITYSVWVLSSENGSGFLSDQI